MHRALVASGVLLFGVTFGGIAAAGPEVSRAPAVTDLSSQNVSAQRAPTRIIVRPTGRPVRECDFHLVRELRAGSPYLVPRQRCWWTRR